MWKTIKLGMAGVAVAFIILMVGVVGYAVGDTGAAKSGENSRRRRTAARARVMPSSTRYRTFWRKISSIRRR